MFEASWRRRDGAMRYAYCALRLVRRTGAAGAACVPSLPDRACRRAPAIDGPAVPFPHQEQRGKAAPGRPGREPQTVADLRQSPWIEQLAPASGQLCLHAGRACASRASRERDMLGPAVASAHRKSSAPQHLPALFVALDLVR
jgi:hypothetical protein